MNNCFISKIFDSVFSYNPAFHYVDQSKKTNFQDLKVQVLKQQAFLIENGVKKGDYVVLAFDSEEKILILFLALISLGAICVPLNPHLTNAELEKILNIIPVKFYYTEDVFFSNQLPVLINDSNLIGLFGFSNREQILQSEIRRFYQPYTNNNTSIPFNMPLPDQIVTCHFTMKGFGKPLGVLHTYDDYCSSLQSCDDIFNFEMDTKVLGLLPCYPIFGLVTNLLYPLTRGCELIIQDKKLKNILKAIDDFNITHVNLVPAIMEKLLIEAQKYDHHLDFSKVCFVTGGSHMKPELYDEFEKTFKTKPVQGYGLTETLVILTNTPKDAKSGSLGKLMRSGVEIKILDARGMEVPQGKAGEICFKGQGVITHYLGEVENREQLFRSGWLRTGDIGCESEDGHISFIGRRLNFTKINANMVDLKEVEDTVKNLNGVKLVRSYVTTENGREKLCLSLFVSRDFSYNKKDISDHCRKELSSFKVPSIIKIYKNVLGEVV